MSKVHCKGCKFKGYIDSAFGGDDVCYCQGTLLRRETPYSDGQVFADPDVANKDYDCQYYKQKSWWMIGRG